MKEIKRYFVLFSLLLVFYQSFAYRLKDEDVIVVDGVIISCIYDISTKGNVIEIPNILDGQTVTGIGNFAFSVAGKIAILTLPTTLKTIGDGVFEGHALTSIDIPAGVTSIGPRAFYGNALANVNLPVGLLSIADETFANNQLTSLTLPAGLKTIGNNAFYNNKITSLTIPNSVETIGWQAFSNNRISALNFQATCQLKEISGWCFASNDIKNLTVPNSVLVIGEAAFQSNANLSNVVFGTNLLKINRSAFNSCNLTSVYFPGTLVFIGRYAFEGNNNLTSLKLPDSAKKYEWNDSNGDKHKAGDVVSEKYYSYVARIPYTLKDEDVEVVNGVITNCTYFSDLTNIGSLITIPSKLDGQDIVGIAQNAFYNRGISELVLPAGIKNIGNWAFYGNEIIHLTLPNSLETIGEYAFHYNCINTLSFEVTSKLDKIGMYAFGSNRLVKIDFPRSIVNIEKEAFRNNLLLSISFETNSKLMAVGSQAFMDNWALVNFTLPDPKANGYNHWLDWSNNKYSSNLVVDNFESFYKIPIEYTLTDDDVVVVDGVIVSCKLSTANVNILTIPDKLDGQQIIGIGERVFQRMGLIGVNLPSSLKNIYPGAFAENEIIKLTIPGGVEKIDNDAFYRNNINELVFEDDSKLMQIGGNAFALNKISSLTLPNNLNYIGWGAFSYNRISNGIVIPDNVEYIGWYVFAGNQIPQVFLGKNSTLSYLGAYAFQDNKISNEIFIPLTLTEISDYAFNNNNISKIITHSGIVEYGNGAFQNNNPALTIVLNEPPTIPQVTHFFGWKDNEGNYHNAGELITDFSDRYKAVIDQFFVVKFVVTDNNNKPIENASIQFYNSTLITKTDGTVSIGPVMRGLQNYVVSASGCYSFSDQVDVQDDMIVPVTLTRFYNVNITVVDKDDIPIVGASVIINGSTLTSTINGKVSLNLPNGDYSFVINAQGYQEYTSSIGVTNADAFKTVTLNHVIINYLPNGGTGTSYTEAASGNTYIANTNSFAKIAYNFSHWNTKADNSGITYKEKESISLKYSNIDLYAIWTPVNYNLIYHLDGGTNAPGNPPTYNIESEINFLPASKPSLYFAAWLDADNKRISKIEKGNVGDIELWAVFTTEPTYYIDYFNLENASHKNQSTYTKFDLPLVFTDAYKKGYEFTGWYEDALFTKKITTIPDGSKKNYSIYAKWGKAVEFSISYDLHGGINHPSNPKNFTIESNPINFEDPSKTGAKFVAWYGDEEMTKKITGLPKGSVGDTIIFAKWILDIYDIQYVLNGGINSPANPTNYTIESNPINFEDPTRNGASFAGWYNDKEFTQKISGIPTGSTGEKIVYARWSLGVYDIQYVLNGGTNSPANPANYTIESNTIKFEAPTRTGASFAGWYNDKEFTQKTTGISTGSTGKKIVYAKWNLGVYDIQYVLNGGINSPANPANYTIESNTIKFEAPTRTGASFAGWYNDKEFTQKISGIPTGNTGNKIVYARWNLDIYDIQYVLNEGINNPANPANYTIESNPINFEAPTRNGASFAGWYNDKEFTQKVSGIPTGSTGNKIVFAKWINIFSVNFIITTDGINPAREVGVVINNIEILKTDLNGLAGTLVLDGSSIKYSIEISGIVIDKSLITVSGSDITVRVQITNCYIRWYDVIFCDNGNGLWTHFAWYKDNIMISDEQFFHNPGGIKDGKYRLILTSVAGVEYTWETDYKATESWKSLTGSDPFEMAVFPNPVKRGGTLSITLSDNIDLQNSNIIIYNNIGTLIKAISNPQYMNEIDINAGFPSGLYHVVLRDDKNEISIVKNFIIN